MYSAEASEAVAVFHDNRMDRRIRCWWRMNKNGAGRKLLGWNRQSAAAPHSPCGLVGQSVLFCPYRKLQKNSLTRPYGYKKTYFMELLLAP